MKSKESKLSGIEAVLDYLTEHRVQARSLVVALSIGFIIMCLAVGCGIMIFSYTAAQHIFN